MPVRLAASDETEPVLVRIGGEVDKLMMSMPPVTAVVPEFWRLVTAATERLGSTAIAVGGPLTATAVAVGALWTWPPPAAGSSGSRTVRSIEVMVVEPLLAIK